MAKRNEKQWSKADLPAERLLEEIGASDLDYYSAGEDRAVGEALRTWPLLKAVSRALKADGAAQRRRADPQFRVVVPDEEPGGADGIEEVADPDALGGETGR